MKSSLTYEVKIEPITDKNAYRVTWLDVAAQTQDVFTQAGINLTPEELESFQTQHANHLAFGQKLFRFLDGDARHLQRALDEAAKQGESLLLQLRASQEVSENRPLKLLFMACSAQEVTPKLDFEGEEETIFRVTEKLPIDMEVEDSGSLEGLRQRLETETFDVMHISGHADIDYNSQPFFIMENETGQRQDVFPLELWRGALKENEENLRLLFLSGCRTGETPPEQTATSFAQQLVEKFNVPAVLSWGRSVADDQATVAEEFIYHELSRGRDLLAAVQRTR